MKKIMFVTGSMARGGAERVISILSKYYINIGHKVSIVMLLHGDVEYELPPEVDLVDLSGSKPIKLICSTRKIFNETKPDVIVAFMGPISIISWLARLGTRHKLICSERIDPSMAKRNLLNRKVLNIVYANSHKSIMQTKRAMQYFPERVQKNSVIIPNPIEVKTYAKREKKPKIVTAGRLTEQKNHTMLIDAFAKIYEKYPMYSLDIYGEGVLREELQYKIDSMGLSKCITLKGNLPNIHEEISDAQIFVLTSNYEGLSNALLEAMMMGLPCISTNCAGSDEAITNMENGILIDVGDKEALVKAMELLISDEKLCDKIGNAAKQSSEYYYVDNVIKQWRNVIEY